MALFDKLPRSASVRAASRSEVTLISLRDFKKMANRVPNWLSILIHHLSLRLRRSNDRLQNLEGDNSITQITQLNLEKIIYLTSLVWCKKSTKDGKSWSISKNKLHEILTKDLKQNKIQISNFIDKLIESNFVKEGTSINGDKSLSINDLSYFDQLLNQFKKYIPTLPDTGIPSSLPDMLTALHSYVRKSPYEQVSCSITILVMEGMELQMKSVNLWSDQFSFFANFEKEIKYIKKGDDDSPTLRSSKSFLDKNIHYLKAVCHLSLLIF